MSEVLSQTEIDTLLSALSSGEINAEEIRGEEHRIKVYDFRRPDKLSKEQMRTLQMIHENLARLITTTLSTHLGTIVEVEVISIEQISYDEFNRSLPDLTVIGIVDMEPLNGQFIVELNPDIAFSIIDRLFGGMGKPLDKQRPFTDLERVIMTKVLNWFLGQIPEAWENIASVNPRIIDVESNTRFIQIVPGNDMTILVTMSVKLAKHEGYINICLPYILIEPIAPRLNTQQWFANKRTEQTEEHIKALRERVELVELDLSVELGSTDLTITDLLFLQPGDVIKLDRRANAGADIRIGNQIRFRGQAGISNKHIGVKITDVVEREGEEDE